LLCLNSFTGSRYNFGLLNCLRCNHVVCALALMRWTIYFRNCITQ
jgi:hypothetical protein